jgi:hypothetical protein
MSRAVSITTLLTLGALATGCTEPPPTSPDVSPQLASTGQPTDQSRNAIDYAVIGDVPYGASATERFPSLIESINQDPKVRRAVHVGDTKSGSTVCSDEWFDHIYDSFNSFRAPLIYTPGDNEWTDCHRDNNGNWNPLERLDAIRSLYFAEPGHTLGGRTKVVMAQDGYPENQLWAESGVVFAAIHIVGSNNNLEPGTCYGPFDAACPDGTSPETAAMAGARIAEATQRDEANRAWLNRAFDLAAEREAAGVVIFSHGDMWHPGDVADGADFSGHQAFVELLAARSAAFGSPVLLFAGDSHNFRVDQPLIDDTSYGAPDAPNVTQITVDRSIEDDIVWLRLHVDPNAPSVFSWEEVVVQ